MLRPIICALILLSVSAPVSAEGPTAVPVLTADMTGTDFVVEWALIDASNVTLFMLHQISTTGQHEALAFDPSQRSHTVGWDADIALFWLEAHEDDGDTVGSNAIWGPLGYPNCPPTGLVRVNGPDGLIHVYQQCFEDPPFIPNN